MPRVTVISSFGALLLAASGIASAQNAYTAKPMNVRAGPNRDYPLVAQLDAGTPLDVRGCLSDWSWCDVSFDDNRGWVYSGGVSFVYQGERVPLYSYAPSLGLAVITFSLGAYWDDYYRGRPWYSQREQWSHRRLPEHQRPPGRPHEGPPPMRNAGPAPEQHMNAPRTRRVSPQPMQHAAPSTMEHGRPPAGGRPEARGEEQGRGAPPARGGQQPQRNPQSGHPPSSRGGSNHDEHDKGRPPQDR